MKSRWLLVLTVLSLMGGLTTGGFAQDASVDVGIANTGTQTFHGPVSIGPSGAEIHAIVQATLERESLNAQRAAELDRQVSRLSHEIGVRRPAVENFLRILGEAQVPIETLNEKLAEIAQRHLDMLERWSVLEEEDDPAIRQRTDAAKAAIDTGDYDRADSLLAEAEELDLAAARQARELEAQARAAANRRFLSAAAKRAERGELRLSRLDYLGAARHFKVAAELVPGEEALVLAGYLMREGSALDDAGRYWEAEKSVKRSLAISEKALGPDHPEVATTLNNLAGLYESQGRYDEAEPLYQRSLAIKEKALGPDHPEVATTLNNLAVLYYQQGEYEKAAQAFERILSIFEKALGPDHPNLAVAMSNYAVILGKLGRDDEAAQWTVKAEAIRQRRGRGQ